MLADYSVVDTTEDRGEDQPIIFIDVDHTEEIVECTPSLELCIVCNESCPYNDEDDHQDSNDIRCYLETVCEVIQLYRTQLIFEKVQEEMNLRQIRFCRNCQYTLRKFRNVQAKLQALNLELANIRSTISKGLFGEIKHSEGFGSELRTLIVAESQSTFVKEEVITGDSISELDVQILNDSDYICEISGFDDFNPLDGASNERSGIDLTPIDPVSFSVVQTPGRRSRGRPRKQLKISPIFHPEAIVQMKPCSVNLTRLNEETGNITSGTRGRRNRLRELLKRKMETTEGSKQLKRKKVKLEVKVENEKNCYEVDASGFARQNSDIEHKPFECTFPNCKARFLGKRFLRYHIKRNHEKIETPYDCAACEARFQEYKELRRHIKNQHTESNGGSGRRRKHLPVSCRQCYKNFGNYIYLTQHLERQEGKCKRDQVTSAKEHSKKVPHTIVQKRRWDENQLSQAQCIFPGCGEKFRSELSLTFHCRKVHEDMDRPYNCAACPVEFREHKELRDHVRTSHREFDKSRGKRKHLPVECAKCNKEFGRYDYLAFHLRRQGGICQKEPLPLNSKIDKSDTHLKKFVCGECGHRSRTRNYLNIHVKATHSSGNPFLCEFCCKSFKRQSTLNTHHRARHPHEYLLATNIDAGILLEKFKELHCDICDKSFSTPQARKNHDQIHTKEWAFRCEVCGTGTATQYTLQLHQLVHTNEKKVSCEKCGMRFKRGDKLKRHMMMKHGGGELSKGFPCDFCSKAFWDSYAKSRHTRIMHRNEVPLDKTQYFKCELCNYTCVIQGYLKIHYSSKKHKEKVKELQDKKPGIK